MVSFAFTSDELGRALLKSGMERPGVIDAIQALGLGATCVDVHLGVDITTVKVRLAASCLQHESCRAAYKRDLQQEAMKEGGER